MSTPENDPQIVAALITLSGSKVVQFPIGADTSGATIYQPGYVLGGGAAPEYCFDNQIGQRCTVPVHRVAEITANAPASPTVQTGRPAAK
jgi:hypothetical protein